MNNAVSWCSKSITYKKHEVFSNVIESANLLVNTNGSILLSEIFSTIKLKLTDCHKNKSVGLEDLKFCQCVLLSCFDNDHTILPSDDFELMYYSLSTQV
ncbi:hypothetical protein P7K49_038546 [Saguinus oedipus]|uniref:MHD domain-containing protein n=1 Tax=Saguinus oedipus TaxID=9490 RepID=A0ABQ9TFA4_SAGOE|nr:hypothetical protein P7K49_038546 [Saguinus oedipus]